MGSLHGREDSSWAWFKSKRKRNTFSVSMYQISYGDILFEHVFMTMARANLTRCGTKKQRSSTTEKRPETFCFLTLFCRFHGIFPYLFLAPFRKPIFIIFGNFHKLYFIPLVLVFISLRLHVGPSILYK